MVVLVLLILVGNLFYFSPAKSSQLKIDIEDSQIPDNYKSYQDAEKLLSTAPRAFTENQDQLENDEVRFYDQGGDVWFTDSCVWFELRDNIDTRGQGSQLRGQGGVSGFDFDPMGTFETPGPLVYKRVVLKQEFVGANKVKPEGREQVEWYNNYLFGNDSLQGYPNVPNYQQIFYENLYNGIDLRYYFSGSSLKYDFIIHPGADPNQIRVKYEGADGLVVDGAGNIIIKTVFGSIIDRDLFIYQDMACGRQKVDGKFVLLSDLEYGFEILGNYSPHSSIVIDPIIWFEYSKLVGGKKNDYGNGVAIDSNGNAYVTGTTASSDFPVTPGAYKSFIDLNYDAFVFKLDCNASKLIYCTYISFEGAPGSDDYSNDITVDRFGCAYITGDFIYPSSIHGYFVFGLNPLGSAKVCAYWSFVGDSSIIISGRGIAVDSKGYLYITGVTNLSFLHLNFSCYDPYYNGKLDVFVVKWLPNTPITELKYSTYLGGSNDDLATDICVDEVGNAYITGYTDSDNFPTTNGAYDKNHNGKYDCFITKIDQNAQSLIYSSFIGGNEDDKSLGLAIDKTGITYLTGCTNSSTFPTTHGAYDRTYAGMQDVFVTKINKNGDKLLLSTFLGNGSYEEGRSIGVDNKGNMYVTGITDGDFPIIHGNNFMKNNLTGLFFKLAADGMKLKYSTEIGGTDGDDFGCALALDYLGNIYLTGYTDSTDLIPTKESTNVTNHGGFDIFIFKYSFYEEHNISLFELSRNNQPVKVIYSRLPSYTIKVLVDNTYSISDTKAIYISLDPKRTNLQFKWDRAMGLISKLSDPNEYVTLEPSSKVIFNSRNNLTLLLNLTFNWTYPDEEFHDIQIKAISNSFPDIYYNATNAYRVENDLEFYGDLLVQGDNSRQIEQDALVRGGEVLTWSGLITVYEGTTYEYPPENEYDITIFDEIDNSWSTSPEEGESFYIKTVTDNNSDLDGNLHSFCITGIPTECDASNISFRIRIDGENVTFSNPQPGNNTWHGETTINIGVKITDHGGGLVDGNSIMYAISDDNGESFNDWISTPKMNDEPIIHAQTMATFKNGRNNFIKWRALDALGNGPAESEQYRILIDTDEVFFSNPWPSASYLSFSSDVEVGINIFDNLSGVNGSRIEYSISENDGLSWNDWTSVNDIKSGDNISVRINITLSPGTKNRIRWRAYDVAGNGPTKSEEYIINLWSSEKKPEISLISPSKGAVIRDTNVQLIWNVTNLSIPGITYNVLIDSFEPPHTVIQDLIIGTSFMVENLLGETRYYWQIVPVINNIEYQEISSEVWWFTVDLSEPPFEKIYNVLINGTEFVSLYPGENINISLQIHNLGNTLDSIKVRIQYSNISTFARFDNTYPLSLASNEFTNRTLILTLPDDISPGKYEILIEAYSLLSESRVNDSHLITVEVLELAILLPEASETEETNWFVYLIFVTILIVIVIIILFILMHKKKAKRELPPTEAVTIKPVAASTSVQTLQESQIAKPEAQIAAKPTVDTSMQLTPATSTSSKPTLGTIPTLAQVPVAQRITEVEPKPLLPPAAAEKMKDKEGIISEK